MSSPIRILTRSVRMGATGLALLFLLLAPALAGPAERAREAQARGDLRTAQIEYRNAVRAEPNAATLRFALAQVSLELGDGVTAEKEARAALERGHDKPAATALLLRGYLVQGRHAELLREVPLDPAAPAGVGGQVAAGRALAELALERSDAARESVATALRLAPQAVEPQLAAAALALVGNDRAAAEAAVDRALTLDPRSAEALMRKGSLLLQRGDARGATEVYGRLLTQVPGLVTARLRRAEALIALGDDTAARADTDAALAAQPGSGPGQYMRAVLQARAADWRGADDSLQRIAPILGNIPDGFLLLATTKRGMGQAAQATDAARRHVARRPEDPRGAKLLAVLELEAGRPDAAAAPLVRLVAGDAADAEAFDLLGRAHLGAGRPREAAAALSRAAELAPGDAGIQARLAASRLAIGDASGAAAAAREAVRLAPQTPGAREVLATALLARGDVAGATAEIAKLDGNARQGEAGGVLEASVRAANLDLAGARSAFETVLRNHAESVSARLGLSRLLTLEDPGTAERLLGEVLQREPGNAEAAGRLAATAIAGGARAAASRSVLEAAQAAAPGNVALALRVADVLVRGGEPARAVALLDADALRAQGAVVERSLARAEARIAAGQLTEALEASRTALAEFPDSTAVRRQLAGLMQRSGDTRGAESVLQEGFRARPNDAGLQIALVALARDTRGIDAALAQADRIAVLPAAMPAASTLRGDLLLAVQRPAEAARAFADAQAAQPSGMLVARQALALGASGRPEDAAGVLRAWLRREPSDTGALILLSSLDITAGRLADAEQNLTAAFERLPDNPQVLNNLAWLLGNRDGEAAARGKALAERSFFLAPNADTADTLGWILARNGDPARAVPLLRQAVAARAASGQQDPGMSYRLAFALNAVGEQAAALQALEPALAVAAFPERADALRLRAELQARR